MHRVIIIGGGFGGLYCAKALKNVLVDVLLIDRRNFHLFQPLLYQVATGELSPGDIASPLRGILNRQKNVAVIEGEVIDVHPATKRISLRDGEYDYDSLVVASGSSHHYFGHEEWGRFAPGLKTIEDALEIRGKIFESFEKAEKETDPEKRKILMTFVIVGGGPTGVELAGALAELAHHTLVRDFRNIDTHDARIILLEGMDLILPSYPPELSESAQRTLKKLGVEIRSKALLTHLDGDAMTIRSENETETIRAGVILWAAGVQASPLGKILAEKTTAPLDKAGRLLVQPDFTLPGHPDVFVIGDLANYSHQGGKPLPGVAWVAMQEGQYVANLIFWRLQSLRTWPFEYKDKGSLAVIGRNAAVADIGRFHFSGFFAWILWVFVHIRYLIEFDNRVVVLFQWAWNYLTHKRGARLITNG